MKTHHIALISIISILGSFTVLDVTAETPKEFPAPGKNDLPLKGTREILNAFLGAPTWKQQIPYIFNIFNGEALRKTIETYYSVRKFPKPLLNSPLKLFQVDDF